MQISKQCVCLPSSSYRTWAHSNLEPRPVAWPRHCRCLAGGRLKIISQLIGYFKGKTVLPKVYFQTASRHCVVVQNLASYGRGDLKFEFKNFDKPSCQHVAKHIAGKSRLLNCGRSAWCKISHWQKNPVTCMRECLCNEITLDSLETLIVLNNSTIDSLDTSRATLWKKCLQLKIKTHREKANHTMS